MVPVEHRVLEIGAGPSERLGDGAFPLGADVLQHEWERFIEREDRNQVRDVAQGDRFIERDAELSGRQLSQVDAAYPGGIQQSGQSPAFRLHAYRVEEILVNHAISQATKSVGQDYGPGVYPLGDATETAGSVVDRIHAGHHGEEHLSRADVAGGLVPPDVLLACLERHPESWTAIAVLGHSDDSSGQVSLVSLFGSKEGGVRPAISHGNAEA